MEQLRRQLQLPKQKPAGVLSARRGLCSESGTAEQPTADKNYFVFLPCRGFVSKDLATAENGRLFFVRRTAQILKKLIAVTYPCQNCCQFVRIFAIEGCLKGKFQGRSRLVCEGKGCRVGIVRDFWLGRAVKKVGGGQGKGVGDVVGGKMACRRRPSSRWKCENRKGMMMKKKWMSLRSR